MRSTRPVTFDAQVAANGRMVLPIAVRRIMGLSGSAKITFRVEGGKVAVETVADRVRRAQDLYRTHATRHQSVDDFLRERRQDDDRRDKALAGNGAQ